MYDFFAWQATAPGQDMVQTQSLFNAHFLASSTLQHHKTGGGGDPPTASSYVAYMFSYRDEGQSGHPLGSWPPSQPKQPKLAHKAVKASSSNQGKFRRLTPDFAATLI